jgi:spore germination protein GerM
MRRTGSRRLVAGAALAGLTGVLLLVLVGCGLPVDSRAHQLANDQIPYGLADPATSTTSTTAPDATAETVTTTAPAGEPVRLYFPGEDGLFKSVIRRITRPVTLEEVVGSLAQGPQAAGAPEASGNLRSVVGSGDVQGVALRGGIAMVALGTHFGELPPSEQRLAVSQLVLTLTDRPGVGQVQFQVGDQPADVPRPDGRLTKAAVSRDDYASMLSPGN